MTRPWEFRPERVDTGDPDGSRAENPFEPAHWYSLPWYAGVLAAVVVFAVSLGLLALAAWSEIDVLFTIAAMVGLFGFVPLLAGLASLFRTLFGEKALKVSVVSVVVLIIVSCAAFLFFVAFKSR